MKRKTKWERLYRRSLPLLFHFSLTGDVDCIRNGRMMIDKVINDEQMRRNQQAQNNARGGFR